MADESLQERLEQAYIRGHEEAYRAMLGECLRQLRDGDYTKEQLLQERIDTMRVLRELGDEIDAEAWPEDAYIPDIIEKCIFNPLYERLRKLEGEEG